MATPKAATAGLGVMPWKPEPARTTPKPTNAITERKFLGISKQYTLQFNDHNHNKKQHARTNGSNIFKIQEYRKIANAAKSEFC